MLKKYHLILLLILILGLAMSLNIYAEKPDLGDVLQEIEDEIQIEREESTIPDIEERPVKEPLKTLAGKKVLVEKIKVEGNKAISLDKLEKIVNTEEYTGKELSLAEMEEAATMITKYYRNRGYFVARAYIPRQEMENNTLTIAVIEGEYGEFKLSNASLVKDSIVQGMLDAIKDKNIISVNTIERAMLIINDTPGVRVTRADVMPGEEVGTSDFVINTEAENRYSGYLVGDNYGGEYTGKERLSAALNVNSPFKIGDKISIRGMLTDKEGIKNYHIAYSLPLNYSGLRGEIGYSNTSYELGKEYVDLKAVGSSTDLEFKFSYPVIWTRTKNLDAFINFVQKDMIDEIKTVADKTQKEIDAVNAGLSYAKNHRIYNWNSKMQVQFDLTLGKLNFKDPVDKTTDETGPNTNGYYSKVNLSLIENIAFNSRWSLESSLTGQYALHDKNLDGSEDFSLGGPGRVKLYPSGEYSAENGYLLNVELYYNLPDYKETSSRVSIFYDYGYANMAHKTPGFEARSLQDIGLGYYLEYRDLFAKVHWAYKLDEDIQSEDDYNSKLLFQVGYVF